MGKIEKPKMTHKDVVISKALRAFDEETSDELIDWFLDEVFKRFKLPWWVPKRIIRGWARKKLDAMLPEEALDLLYKFLDKIGVD